MPLARAVETLLDRMGAPLETLMKKTLLAVVLSGCSTAGAVNDIQTKSNSVPKGATPEQVQTLMGGPPGSRSFQGEIEAWQYCSTGFVADQYVIIWFVDGVVDAVTPYSGTHAVGSCAGGYRPIDWSPGQASGATVNINVR